MRACGRGASLPSLPLGVKGAVQGGRVKAARGRVDVVGWRGDGRAENQGFRIVDGAVCG